LRSGTFIQHPHVVAPERSGADDSYSYGIQRFKLAWKFITTTPSRSWLRKAH
jgi:hypothetical protein